MAATFPVDDGHMADPPTPVESSGLTENSTLALVFWSITFLAFLPAVVFGVTELTGVSATRIWAWVVLAGVVAAFPARTRVFGLACVIATMLVLLFFAVAMSQVS